MSKQGATLPYAQRCHGCHPEMNGTFSDQEVLCARCKGGLSGEENTEESKSVLQPYRDAMEVESSTYTDFISCDRAGRRNAVHDIQRDATTISMRKLTEDLGDLAVEGAESQRDATSSENDPGARPKGQENSSSP
ncbi:camp-dependent protein kinase inhibitor gamma [Limosa lapponica baueri]|uniref:Camp-dependent protein kinase inhibitor gamma n=2 Tax=Neoaves TaxID=3078114 RepID=A0A2I0TH06_LIMLA|nr:camp-dependent protein kinase inhibitor gamma [Limosa lapponica baueri]